MQWRGGETALSCLIRHRGALDGRGRKAGFVLFSLPTAADVTLVCTLPSPILYYEFTAWTDFLSGQLKVIY